MHLVRELIKALKSKRVKKEQSSNGNTAGVAAVPMPNLSMAGGAGGIFGGNMLAVQALMQAAANAGGGATAAAAAAAAGSSQ